MSASLPPLLHTHGPDPRGKVPTWAAQLERKYGPEVGRQKALEVAQMIEKEAADAPPAELAPAAHAAPDPDARRAELAQVVLEHLDECLPPVLERVAPELAELLGREDVSVRDFVVEAVALALERPPTSR